MKPIIGKWHKTKNGSKAYVAGLLADECDGYHYVGSIDGLLEQWNDQGKRYTANDGKWDRPGDIYDIQSEWSEPQSGEVWVDVFNHGHAGQSFMTSANKTRVIGCNQGTHIARIKVQWREGRFDD